jgi:hypothetical protein
LNHPNSSNHCPQLWTHERFSTQHCDGVNDIATSICLTGRYHTPKFST